MGEGEGAREVLETYVDNIYVNDNHVCVGMVTFIVDVLVS